MTNINLEQLALVVGGAGDSMQNIRGRNGDIVGGPGDYNKHTTEFSKPPHQRFNEHMDRVQAPWTFFNNLFGGTRGPRPTIPPPPRPRLGPG